MAKRGRPRKQPKLEGDLFIALDALRQIASGDPIRWNCETLGRTYESTHPESEAFQWAQAFAKGTLVRLGEETHHG